MRRKRKGSKVLRRSPVYRDERGRRYYYVWVFNHTSRGAKVKRYLKKKKKCRHCGRRL